VTAPAGTQGGGARLIAAPHPFSADRIDGRAEEGATIAAIVAALFPDRALHDCLRVWITDVALAHEPVAVPREAWARLRPKRGAAVLIRPVPQGGGGGGKNPLRIVLSIAIVAASFFLGPAVGAALGLPAESTLGGLLATPIKLASAVGGFLITATGTLLLNALIPPPRPALSQLSVASRTSPTLALTGTSNRAAPWQPVPRVYGRHRVYPPLAARTLLEGEGQTQYLRALFDFGYGPLQIEDIRIGQVPIGQFDGVETQLRAGYETDAPITLYPNAVREDGYAWRLRAADPAVVVTRSDASEAIVDVTFIGLVVFSPQDGSRQPRSVELRFEYAAEGSSDWIAAGTRTFTAATEQRLVFGHRLPLPVPGRWQIRVTRLTADATSSSVRDETYLTALRSVTGEAPVRARGRCLLAVRIRASEQLSGQLDQLNAIATSILPVWTGTGWVSQATRNPAWVYADVLRGRANPRPIPDDRIDLDLLALWAQRCDAAPAYGEAPRFQFDAVFDAETTVLQALRDVAAAGRAAPAMREGRFSVVLDEPQTVPIQLFSPRNARGFVLRRTFRRPLHGFRVRYVEPQRDWTQQEVLVYADGYAEHNATEIETLELWGVTRRDQAVRDARYHLAVHRLRSETVTITVDIEHLLCTRGDLVRVVYDVPLWGSGVGRVREVVTDGAGDVTALLLDTRIGFGAGTAYAARIRRSDGASVLATLATTAGETDTLTLAPPLPAAAGVAVGDLVLVGEAGRESVEMLVREIRPGPELSAELTLVSHAPAVHEAEALPIPLWDPEITRPPALTRRLPQPPEILGWEAGSAALGMARAGAIVARIGLRVRPAEADRAPGIAVQVRWRPALAGDDHPWQLGPAEAWADHALAFTGPLVEGAAYELAARVVTAAGDAGPWSPAVTVVAEGELAPPSDVSEFLIDGRRLTWRAVQDLDVAGYRIRWAGGANVAWELAQPAHEGLVTSSPFLLDVPPAGQMTVLIKAVDRGGRESRNAAAIVTELGDAPLRFGAAQIDARALGWPGTRVNAVVDAGDLAAAADPGEPMWTAAGALLWTDDAAAMWPADTWAALAYQQEVAFVSPPQGARIAVAWDAQGTGPRLLWREISAYWTDDGAAMWGADGALMWPNTGGGDWQDWAGAVAARPIALRVEIEGGAVRGRLTELRAILDVEPLVEALGDVALDAAGTRLPLSRTFTAIGAVTVTLQGGSARTVQVLDRDPALGPLVQAFDASGAGVAATVDAVVHGY
jgi:predicted phage tail protein